MVTTALKGKKNLRTQVCTTGDPHLFSHRHTLVDKDNTEWSDDQNNIRAEEACRAHKTGKIKNTGGWRGVAHNKKGMKSWNDYHRLIFTFFSQTQAYVTYFEKSLFQIFFHFSKLFLSPSELNMDVTISHKGPEKEINHRKHGTYIYSHNKLKKKEKKQNQLHVFDVIGTKQRQVRKKSAVLVPTAHARQW